HADAQQPTRRAPKIEFTEPGTTTTTTTNAAEAAPKKSPSKLNEKAVRKPLDFYDLEDSFSGVPAPGSRTRLTPPQSKPEREQMERKKNWVFNTPEEALGVATPEDMLEVPEFEANGEAKKMKSSLERYLLREEKARTEAGTNHVKGDKVAEAQKEAE